MSGPGSSKRDGVSSILKGSRLICRMVGRYGVVGLAGYPPEFVAAVVALNAACAVFKALDDNPSESDATAGGPGDGVFPS